MPTVDVDGVILYYEERGRGKPIVFCHGIPTDYRAWNAQVEAFSKNYRAITYSRRYAAPNKREGDVTDSTIGNNAADLKGLIEKLGVAPVHLVGHSYGGFVSAFLAADHPSLLRSLVLVEPAISTLLLENEHSRGEILSLLFRSPSVALSARRFINNSLNPALMAIDAGEDEKAVELNVDGVQDQRGAFGSMPEETRRMMIENAKTVAEQRTKIPPFKAHIGRIACKTMIINGVESALWLRRIGDLAAKSIPDCRAVRLQHSRHFPHMENSAEFNDRVGEFFQVQLEP